MSEEEDWQQDDSVSEKDSDAWRPGEPRGGHRGLQPPLGIASRPYVAPHDARKRRLSHDIVLPGRGLRRAPQRRGCSEAPQRPPRASVCPTHGRDRAPPLARAVALTTRARSPAGSEEPEDDEDGGGGDDSSDSDYGGGGGSAKRKALAKKKQPAAGGGKRAAAGGGRGPKATSAAKRPAKAPVSGRVAGVMLLASIGAGHEVQSKYVPRHWRLMCCVQRAGSV